MAIEKIRLFVNGELWMEDFPANEPFTSLNVGDEADVGIGQPNHGAYIVAQRRVSAHTTLDLNMIQALPNLPPPSRDKAKK